MRFFTYPQCENLFFEVPRAPKSKQNRFQDLFGTTCVLRSRFGSIFGRFWEPFWSILEPKCLSKSIPKSDHIFGGVLGRLGAVQGVGSAEWARPLKQALELQKLSDTYLTRRWPLPKDRGRRMPESMLAACLEVFIRAQAQTGDHWAGRGWCQI